MDNLELLLKERGLTKVAFSDMLGIKKQNLNALLKNPTLETIKRFAAALDVPVWRLFSPSSGVCPKGSDFAAFVRYEGKSYTPATLGELRDLADKLAAVKGDG